MMRYLKTPEFIFGISIRITLLVLITPPAISHWYLPFMTHQSGALDWNPWGTFLASGGSPLAFPYGYAMWAAFLPLVELSQLISIDPRWGYGATLLLVDGCLAWLISHMTGIGPRLTLRYYWLSPIAIFSTYWLGLNDIIPVALLCAAMLTMRRFKPVSAGILTSVAISAKLSMLLAVPIFFLYLFRNRGLRSMLPRYAYGLVITGLILGLPFIASGDGVSMLVNNPELAKTFDFSIGVSSGHLLHVLPLTYLLMLYVIWRIRRISFDLLQTLMGISFFLVLLLSPAAPGWYAWVLPLLAYHQATGGNSARILVAMFSLAYITANLLFPAWPGTLEPTLSMEWTLLFGPHISSLVTTVLFVLGIVLVARVWRESVKTNDYYRLSRRPFVLGIAGDSGAGKDTLTDSIADLFGSHSVVRVSGDDYHRWDRHKPMWQVMTHLHPSANDLESFAADVIALADGKRTMARHYDHSSGRMSKPKTVQSNDVIIASGLHALYKPFLCSYYDLSIYLDIDEDLRRYFKIARDVGQRGHPLSKVLESIERRAKDAERFIYPQKVRADLIISLQPTRPEILQEPEKQTTPLRFKLYVKSKHGLHENSLERALVGICGLHVDTMLSGDNATVEMIIEGDATAEDVEFAAKTLFPNISELFDRRPHWRDGITGLMQLIVLTHMTQALRKRLTQ